MTKAPAPVDPVDEQLRLSKSIEKALWSIQGMLVFFTWVIVLGILAQLFGWLFG